LGVRALGLLFLIPALARAQPHEGRAHASGNGVWSIQLLEDGPDKCRVETRRDTDPAWSLERCVGTVDDLLFISNDGERFWVLTALPKTPAPVKAKGKKAPPPGEPFIRAVVATLFDKQGNSLSTRTLHDFMTKRFDKLRDLDQRFEWLEGVAGVPGRRPRATDANQVEFETVEPRTHRLDF
jgi:hypothetical protein